MAAPLPVARDHLGIIAVAGKIYVVGGFGPKRTPALAVRYADEFNGALGEDLEAIASIETAGLTLLHKKRSPSFNVAKSPEVYNYVFVRS